MRSIALPGERRPDDVVEPAVALLVGGQHGDRRRLLVGAGLDQLGARLLLDLPADLGRLAEPRLDRHRRPLLRSAGIDLRAQLRPELVDLRRDLEVVVDERARLSARRGSARRRSTAPRLIAAAASLLDDVGEPVGRLLDEDLHARRREILALQLLAELVELVEAHRRLSRRRSAGDELPHVVFDVVERRAVLAARPDVREASRRAGGRRARTPAASPPVTMSALFSPNAFFTI